MRKKSITAAFFVTLVTALLILGCPSEALPSPVYDIAGDIVLKDGIEEFVLGDKLEGGDLTTVEMGKTYEVIINAKDVNSILYGCHFQGQLFADVEDSGTTTRYLLAGSQNATPSNVAGHVDHPKRFKNINYRMTFTLGENFGDDDDGSSVLPEPWQSITTVKAEPSLVIPADAKIIFRLSAKTPNWYSWGVSDQPNNGNSVAIPESWGVNYYQPGTKGKIKGSISMRLKPNVVAKPGEPIWIVNDNATELSWGKGNIEGDDFKKLLEAPEGALLRVTFTAIVNSAGSGSGDGRPADSTSTTGGVPASWGSGSFGITSEVKSRGQDITVGFGPSSPLANGRYPGLTNDIPIDLLLGYSEITETKADGSPKAGLIFLNVNNYATVTKLQIWTVSADPNDRIDELLEKIKELEDRIKDLEDGK